NLLLVGDITGNGKHFIALSAHVLTRALQFLLVASTKNQFAALARELFGHCQPEPARTPGDENCLPTKIVRAEAERFQCGETAFPHLPPERATGKCRSNADCSSRRHCSRGDSAKNEFAFGLHECTSGGSACHSQFEAWRPGGNADL